MSPLNCLSSRIYFQWWQQQQQRQRLLSYHSTTLPPILALIVIIYFVVFKRQNYKINRKHEEIIINILLQWKRRQVTIVCGMTVIRMVDYGSHQNQKMRMMSKYRWKLWLEWGNLTQLKYNQPEAIVRALLVNYSLAKTMGLKKGLKWNGWMRWEEGEREGIEKKSCPQTQ